MGLGKGKGKGKGGVVRCGGVGRWEVIWRVFGHWGGKGGRVGGWGEGVGEGRGGEGRGDTVDSRICVCRESGEWRGFEKGGRRDMRTSIEG